VQFFLTSSILDSNTCSNKERECDELDDLDECDELDDLDECDELDERGGRDGCSDRDGCGNNDMFIFFMNI
jgi:hypothetical protein